VLVVQGMKFVLFYESAPGFMAKVPAHIDAHRSLWKESREADTLLLFGPFTDSPAGSAMGVFRTREAAESFVARDPFVRHGIVARYLIREWAEVLAP